MGRRPEILIPKQVDQQRHGARLSHQDGPLTRQASDRQLAGGDDCGRRIQVSEEAIQLHGRADIVECSPVVPLRTGGAAQQDPSAANRSAGTFIRKSRSKPSPERKKRGEPTATTAFRWLKPNHRGLFATSRELAPVDADGTHHQIRPAASTRSADKPAP